MRRIPAPVRLAAFQCLNYAVVAANFRYLARANYFGTIATDVGVALIGWTLTKMIAAETTWRDRVGYVLGSALGSSLGIWITR